MKMNPGLCGQCEWARTVVSDRGSVFWMCGRAKDDVMYPKYPRIPVFACRGFVKSTDPPQSFGAEKKDPG